MASQLLSLFFELGSLTEPRASRYPGLGLQARTSHPTFDMGTEEPNPGPHVYTTNRSLDELSSPSSGGIASVVLSNGKHNLTP